jgi:hypothetical protein
MTNTAKRPAIWFSSGGIAGLSTATLVSRRAKLASRI